MLCLVSHRNPHIYKQEFHEHLCVCYCFFPDVCQHVKFSKAWRLPGLTLVMLIARHSDNVSTVLLSALKTLTMELFIYLLSGILLF